MITSTFTKQDDLLSAIVELHAPEGFECDLTYGNGAFWRRLPRPRYCYDIEPLSDCVVRQCSTAIQHPDASIGHTVFDPPFLTYVRAGRGGNGEMAMAKRYGGYWRYDELEKHYTETLLEYSRVLKPKATLTVKCQDIVHNHRHHSTHTKVIGWAEDVGFALKDLFILLSGKRMPSPNRAGKQKHARVFHSYFLVFERLTPEQERRRLSA